VVDPSEPDEVMTVQPDIRLPVVDNDDSGQVIAVRGQPRLPY
jgi:hypothetical protein